MSMPIKVGLSTANESAACSIELVGISKPICILSTARDFFCWVFSQSVNIRCLGVSWLLVAVLAGGCNNGDKQASFQVRVAELDARNQYLSQEINKLQTENGSLKRDLALAKKELAELSAHTEKVRQLNSALLNDTEALRNAFDKLKAEHEKLVIENIELKRELTERRRPMTMASAVGPRKNPPGSSEKTRSAGEEKVPTPCEAIVQLVQRCEEVARNYKGDEQRQRLRTLHAQFQELTEKAPTQATEALNAWLTDLSRLSADPLDAALFPLFVRKHAILKSCVRQD